VIGSEQETRKRREEGLRLLPRQRVVGKEAQTPPTPCYAANGVGSSGANIHILVASLNPMNGLILTVERLMKEIEEPSRLMKGPSSS
jgi:hypothetical protein